MPAWLQGMIAPTVMLWLYAVALGVALAAAPAGELPLRADMASRVALPLIMAWWVTADAQKRRRQLCYDYASFVFFVWPLIMPIYLFQTRGTRAFLTLLCFAGICFVAGLAASVVLIIQEFLSP
jgi:hypothetical protein